MKLGGGHCAWKSQKSWQGRLWEWWWSKYVISQGIKISQLGGGVAHFNPCTQKTEAGVSLYVPGTLVYRASSRSAKATQENSVLKNKQTTKN